MPSEQLAREIDLFISNTPKSKALQAEAEAKAKAEAESSA